MKHVLTILTFMFVILTGCNKEEKPKLSSVEERVTEATTNLAELLTEPTNGWRLEYQPTSQTGTFLILMDFRDDGTVRIQSDVSANNGEFRDHIIAYRIDSSQGLELTLETYGVFHNIFELEQNSFGGEFVFVFIEESEDNLIFRSKSDKSSKTVLTFEPSTSTDSNLISSEAMNTLRQGVFQSDDLGNIGGMGNFNFFIPENNHTISVTFELQSRTVKLLGIAEGKDMAAIVAANSISNIDHESAFSLSNESVVLDDPQTITFRGISYKISELPIEGFSKTVESFCTGQRDSVINLAGSASFGDFTAKSSLFQTYNGFQPKASSTYTMNYHFLYDENDNSISEQIEAVFPDVITFQWYNGFEISDSLFTGIGFVTRDEFNNDDFYLRGIDMTQVGNYVQLTFNENDIITDDDAPQQQLDDWKKLMDEMFSGGNVYVLEMLNEGGLFEYYNPCNRHKGYLLP